MEEDDLELRCKKAILSIASDVRDIKHKFSYFLENYREDYYDALNGIKKKQINEYQK